MAGNGDIEALRRLSVEDKLLLSDIDRVIERLGDDSPLTAALRDLKRKITERLAQ